MPEGDTIYRAAATMNRALAGAVLRSFEFALPRLKVFAENHHLVGRTVDRVEPRGKYLLVHFSGGVTLLTHLRMNGSWHLYRQGERWRRPRSQMRVRLVTDEWEAVGFGMPIAEFHDERSLARSSHLRALGPDLLSSGFDAGDAIGRLREAGNVAIEEALLDQRRMAGIGNVLKCETLFLAGVHPFAPVSDLDRERLAEIVRVAERLLRDNVVTADRPAIARMSASRNTTRSANPAAQLYVYGRARKPCRRCGTLIQCRKSGRDARLTYWCPECQRPET